MSPAPRWLTGSCLTSRSSPPSLDRPFGFPLAKARRNRRAHHDHMFEGSENAEEYPANPEEGGTVSLFFSIYNMVHMHQFGDVPLASHNLSLIDSIDKDTFS